MTDPYRTPGRTPTWYHSDGDAIRISEIRSVCQYQSRKSDPLPYTVVFKTGPSIFLSKEDGERLVGLLND